MRIRGIIVGLLLTLGAVTVVVPAAQAADAPIPAQAAGDQTPPRLSYLDGQVSFWRPGAQDWAQAQINTPLAPGDQLSTGAPGTLEIQIGDHAFVRGKGNTQIGLENQEPDYVQFKVTAGSAMFDLRGLDRGQMVEVDTPNAAFTIDQPGYYRVEVSGERTSFITRRTGRATVIPASGEAVEIAPSEEVVITGTASPQVASYTAPKFDDWDKWNYARTNALLDAVSARYVSPGTYGVSELDRYGSWRVVPEYGSVWIPTAVQPGWAPYSTGSWTNDPTYGWTWVDTAPWGWAPYHYGRWVSVGGFWAWAPGPVVARPVYAPALVAFFGGPSVSVGISIGGPVVGWVALGWGEPLVPWWGRPGFIHEPSWGGWGGPRFVNNEHISNSTVVNVQHINVYRNSGVRNAVVVVNENRFGRGPITAARVAQVDARSLQPIHTAPQIAPTPASFVPTATRGIRPPEASLNRPVVATRPPRRQEESTSGTQRTVGPAGVQAPAPRLVTAPQQREPTAVLPRPAFGKGSVERPPAARVQPPSTPAIRGPQQPAKGVESVPSVTRPAPPQPAQGVASPPPAAPAAPAARVQPPAPSQKQAGPQRPEKGSGVAPTVTRQVPPPSAPGATVPPPATRHPEAPQAASPSPAAPAALPSPAARVQPSASPQRPERGVESVPPVTRQAPPPQTPAAPSPARPAARPSPAAPAPPAAVATTPPPSARRPEAATTPARSLPGEPANRIAPNRVEKSPPQSHPTREPQAARPSPSPSPAAAAPPPAPRRPETPPAARPSPAAPAPPAAGVQAPAPPQKQGRPQGPEKGVERKGSPD